jgi:hypothetical protein
VGKTATMAVTEERDLTSAALLTNSPDEQVRLFLQSPVVGEKAKEGLRKAQELRWEWARARREVAERQWQLQASTSATTPPTFFPAWPGRGVVRRIWWTSVDLW